MLFIQQRYFGYPWFWLASFLTLGLLISLNSSNFQVLLVLGLLLGAVLNYFMFGFTSAWRSFILEKKTVGIRAQIWMLALASILFFPLILLETLAGQDYQGLIRPVSLSVVLGAFLFGIGMQLAGSCSSGTLNRLGKLAPFSFITFPFLLVGGVIGSYFYGDWVNWPTLGPTSFSTLFNGFGLLISFAIFITLYSLLKRYEIRKTGDIELIVKPAIFNQSKLQRLHPLLIAGLLLALLNAIVFLWSGQPWSIASIFTIWGVKFAEWSGFGLDWAFWDIAVIYEARFERPVLEDPVSLTTIGVILGSLLVTLLGRSSKHEAIKLKNTVYAIVGGLLMGFGATLSYGCNIGAFFSGIASGSLHGWVWIVFAVLGNIVALKLVLRK